MPSVRLDRQRQQFQQRLRLQFQARYPGWEFLAPPDRFALMARGSRSEVALSLESLYAETRRPGASAPGAISSFVAAAEPRLSRAEQVTGPTTALAPDPGALVWCVRDERSIRAFSRFAELAVKELPGGLLAFVAETLPGESMQGVSRAEAEAGGLSEADLRCHADRNTELRLTRWREELAETGGRENFLFTTDQLFSSSLLLVPGFLQRLAQLGGGHAALAAPDRAMLVAAVGGAAAPERMRQVVRRLYRIASFPLSPVLLSTDGVSLEVHPGARPITAKSVWNRLFRDTDS
ncbi:MAG: hypothetical protein ACREN7_08035 [Candidatus Dormibacteria bacterium]